MSTNRKHPLNKIHSKGQLWKKGSNIHTGYTSLNTRRLVKNYLHSSSIKVALLYTLILLSRICSTRWELHSKYVTFITEHSAQKYISRKKMLTKSRFLVKIKDKKLRYYLTILHENKSYYIHTYIHTYTCTMYAYKYTFLFITTNSIMHYYNILLQ